MKKNRNAERRRREDRGAVGAENRGAEGAEGGGMWEGGVPLHWEGGVPSPPGEGSGEGAVPLPRIFFWF